jgi:sulfate-transporting ATPase
VLEHFLQRFSGPWWRSPHDRYFLRDNAAEWILELDRGQASLEWATTLTWLDQKETAARSRAEERRSAMSAMKDELKWVRSNAKPRQTKSKAPGPASRS